MQQGIPVLLQLTNKSGLSQDVSAAMIEMLQVGLIIHRSSPIRLQSMTWLIRYSSVILLCCERKQVEFSGKCDQLTLTEEKLL